MTLEERREARESYQELVHIAIEKLDAEGGRGRVGTPFAAVLDGKQVVKVTHLLDLGGDSETAIVEVGDEQHVVGADRLLYIPTGGDAA